MKKVMLIGLLALSSAASVAFSFQSSQSLRAKAPTCKKVVLTCPDGRTYYKCIQGSTNSPDCWYVGGTVNQGCNITEYPCGGPVFP